jgi:hypothetical protein
MLDQPVNDTDSSPVTVKQVHAEFEKLLKDRTHMGVGNFLGDIVLEPRNPFQKKLRLPQKWVGATLVIFLLGLVMVYWFHVR